MQTGIAFDHVSFQYPTGTREVLEDISLTIRPGEVVALVGENGSGKTTLIKLLCRLYDPASGIITLDGIDLRQLETTALRREISVIFQDYAQYHLTARENIWFGNVALPPDQERIAAAARHAGADEVIAGLPQGYETILGKWFEDGEELSVGEWQKVALARAFLRDAQIIVLDEPTSALDARAEYEVFKKFRQLAAGRTVILISHRFSTVRMADRIFVLEGGRIIESGAHDELVRLGGTYARLFETQAQYYR
jgi:ATP-binding cassette subfamily B protein